MPTGLTGRETRMAFIKAASWGTASPVTRGVYFNSTAGMGLKPARINDEAFGQQFLGRGDHGDIEAPDLTFEAPSRYNDHTYVLDALAMGSPSAVTLSNSAAGQTPSFQHIIDLAPSTDGLVATFAADKVYFVDELTSAKIFGFTETVGDGGVMNKAYRVLGSRTTDISSTNTRSIVNSASFLSLGDRVTRPQGTFRMNVQGASSLSSGDALALEDFSFTFERPQDAPNVFGQDYVFEPADNGFTTIGLEVTYPRMTQASANSLYAAMRTNPVFKADMTYLGAYINSVDRLKRLYQFPALELDSFENDVTGAEQVKPKAKFTAKLALSSPSGMPFVNPFRLTLVMPNSAVAF